MMEREHRSACADGRLWLPQRALFLSGEDVDAARQWLAERNKLGSSEGSKAAASSTERPGSGGRGEYTQSRPAFATATISLTPCLPAAHRSHTRWM